ncbi:MAG: hypothetical protein PHT59_01010 [Candidatus Omnitrophica bacterium]|nr:hypothetical protein [Candidatus Omnitrophota bacterium]
MRKTSITIVLMAFSLAGFAGALFAQDAKEPAGAKQEPVIDMQVREAKGEVVVISRRSISLMTSRDAATGEETEILLPYDKTLVIEHKRSLSEIQSGDRVSIKYTEEVIDYGDKKESKVLAKVVTFLNPANQDSPYKKAREAAQQATTQQETAQQETEQQESLPLKGVKSDE